MGYLLSVIFFAIVWLKYEVMMDARLPVYFGLYFKQKSLDVDLRFCEKEFLSVYFIVLILLFTTVNVST